MNRAALLSAVAASGFAALFLADLRGYFNVTASPIATLEETDGNVSRLAKNQLTWDRAQKSSLFSAGDTIATGEAGHARLAFNVGGEVELEPGSMLILGEDPKELKLNFLSGKGRVRVTAATQSKLKIIHSSNTLDNQPDNRGSTDLDSEVEVVTEKELSQRPQVASKPKAKPVIPITSIKAVTLRNPAQTLASGGGVLSVQSLPPIPKPVTPNDVAFDMSSGKINKLQWALPESGTSVSGGSAGPGGATSPAFSYEVTVKPAENPEKLITLRSDRTAVAVNDLPRGKYLWSVRTVSNGHRSPASVSQWIEIRVPQNLAKPFVFPVEFE